MIEQIVKRYMSLNEGQKIIFLLLNEDCFSSPHIQGNLENRSGLLADVDSDDLAGLECHLSPPDELT